MNMLGEKKELGIKYAYPYDRAIRTADFTRGLLYEAVKCEKFKRSLQMHVCSVAIICIL